MPARSPSGLAVATVQTWTPAGGAGAPQQPDHGAAGALVAVDVTDDEHRARRVGGAGAHRLDRRAVHRVPGEDRRGGYDGGDDRHYAGCVRTASSSAAAASLRYWCTNAIAMLPSPTAAATRLTGPNRTSPQAKMPGTLVSSR